MGGPEVPGMTGNQCISDEIFPPAVMPSAPAQCAGMGGDLPVGSEGVGFPGGFTMIGSNTVAVLQAPQATSVQAVPYRTSDPPSTSTVLTQNTGLGEGLLGGQGGGSFFNASALLQAPSLANYQIGAGAFDENGLSIKYLLKKLGMTPSGARKALLKLSGANMLKKKDHACNWCEVQKVLRSIPKYKTQSILFFNTTEGRSLRSLMGGQDVQKGSIFSQKAEELLMNITVVNNDKQEVWATAESWAHGEEFLRRLGASTSKYIKRSTKERKNSPGSKTVIYVCHRAGRPYWEKLAGKEHNGRRGSKRIGCNSQVVLSRIDEGPVAISIILKHDNHETTAPTDSMLLTSLSQAQEKSLCSPNLTGVSEAVNNEVLLRHSNSVSSCDLIADGSQSGSQSMLVNEKKRKLLREHCTLLHNLTYQVPDESLDMLLSASESLLDLVDPNATSQQSTAGGMHDFQTLKKFQKQKRK